jgi:hypothetical protein
MSHALYDIWEDVGGWCAQLVNYVGRFPSKAAAESFVASVKDYRKKNGLK